MKKIALIGLVTLCSAAAYAQGTVIFTPFDPGTSSATGVDAQVWSPNPGSPTVEEQGATASDITGGAYTTANGFPTLTPTTYAGTPLGGSSYTGSTPVSFAGAGVNVYDYGNLFTAELYALSSGTTQAIPANATSLASLSPVTQYKSTFYDGVTGAGVGYFIQANPAAPDPGIPGTGFIGTISSRHTGTPYLGNNAAAAVVAWFNGGGQFTTLAAAQAASVPWGQSAIFEINGLTEPYSVMYQDSDNNSSATPQNTLTYLNGYDGNALGGSGAETALQSFSLTAPVPEPSTIALGVMGACAFLARRRKK
jgi:hypothetical protein